MLFCMSLSFDVEHREGYSVLRLKGEPSLGQFLSFLQLMGIETAGWPVKRALLDVRGVQSLGTAAEHEAIGEETARQLRHLDRVASLVDPKRITRAGERAAQRAGLDLRVFADEREAIEWLSA
jgi:hypothetical protein